LGWQLGYVEGAWSKEISQPITHVDWAHIVIIHSILSNSSQLVSDPCLWLVYIARFIPNILSSRKYTSTYCLCVIVICHIQINNECPPILKNLNSEVWIITCILYSRTIVILMFPRSCFRLVSFHEVIGINEWGRLRLTLGCSLEEIKLVGLRRYACLDAVRIYCLIKKVYFYTKTLNFWILIAPHNHSKKWKPYSNQ